MFLKNLFINGNKDESILKLDKDYQHLLLITKARLKALNALKNLNLNVSMTLFEFLPDPHGHFSFLPTFLKSEFFLI